jgi:hypothetical protein
MKTQTLYRPVGLTELALIAGAGWRAFPPRLDWQPIFYPVLNEAYAAQIAKEWNAPDAFSGYLGAVTRFAVRADFLSGYAVQHVGADGHDELWIPADELDAFNAALATPIEVTQAFFEEAFAAPQNETVHQLLRQFR